MAMLYGGSHPYGRRMRGTVESVARVDRHAIQQFHVPHAVPTGLSLAVVGASEPARAIDAAHSMFGEWRGPAAVEVTNTPIPARAGRRCQVLPRMNKSQTAVRSRFAAIA